MIEVVTDGPLVVVQDELVRGVFGGCELGNVDPRFGDQEEVANSRRVALSKVLGSNSLEGPELVAMIPTGKGGFVDLDDDSDPSLVTDGLVSSDPDKVLSGNPADCEMIAMYGYGGREVVMGLFHVNRLTADRGGHIEALKYVQDRHGLDIGATRLIFAPSIKADSYRFPDIDPQQQEDPTWADFIEKREDGLWHVDVHGKVRSELIDEGVAEDNIYVHPVDVGSSPHYFSHRQFIEDGQKRGRNAVMFKIV